MTDDALGGRSTLATAGAAAVGLLLATAGARWLDATVGYGVVDLLGNAVLAAVGLVLTWVVLVRWRGSAPAEVGLRVVPATLGSAGLGVVLGAAAAALANAIAVLAGGFDVAPGVAGPEPGLFVAMTAFAAGALFRQVFLQMLVSAMRLGFVDGVAVWVPAAIVALVRLDPASPLSVLDSALTAGAFGLLFLGQRDGRPDFGLPVAAHAGWSVTHAMLFGLPLAGTPSPWHFVKMTPLDVLWSGGAYGPEGGLGGLVGALALLAVALRRRWG